MITYEKVQGKDPFWNNSAKNLLEGLIGFFLEEYKDGKIKREQITMTSIRKFQIPLWKKRIQGNLNHILNKNLMVVNLKIV